MKKIILPIILLVFSVSCKKQYSCECPSSSGGSFIFTNEFSVFKKGEVREGCEQDAWGSNYSGCHLID